MPADKAGLMPGDIIVAIDELYISDMKYGEDEAWLRLSGKAGTKVTLTINRNGQVFDVEVERVAGW
jgi:carboxyl-terminal processing protease